ncbi:hypothetical protein FB451DRAFT_1249420 [Mycena latifolia]|nr:hypothetical protein FB451DRAFT_1249420 [Mycena latifolia]
MRMPYAHECQLKPDARRFARGHRCDTASRTCATSRGFASASVRAACGGATRGEDGGRCADRWRVRVESAQGRHGVCSLQVRLRRGPCSRAQRCSGRPRLHHARGWKLDYFEGERSAKSEHISTLTGTHWRLPHCGHGVGVGAGQFVGVEVAARGLAWS